MQRMLRYSMYVPIFLVKTDAKQRVSSLGRLPRAVAAQSVGRRAKPYVLAEQGRVR